MPHQAETAMSTATASESASATLAPLAGLRVLDFTSFPPGGACTVMLADLGAEVIRVESPAQKGKPSLIVGQVALSRGKRSITLDMRNPQANEVLLRLARSVDIVVENAKPGSMEARGFGYRQARECNPRIIWCAITGYGQTGPNAEHAGHDISYLAHSGLLSGLSDEMPWHPAMMIGGSAAAQSAVIAIQAALLQAARSAEGAFLDISLSEASGWFLTCGINALTAQPYRIAATPDRRLYRCADGRFVAVACAEPRTWKALCEGLALPGLVGCLHQQEHAQAVARELEAVFLTRPAAEWVERLAPDGAAVAVVNAGADLEHDPHVSARGAIARCGDVLVPASPIRMENADGLQTGTCGQPPHMTGDDTGDVLQSAGFTPEEVRTLEACGVI
ncbi:MAG: CaiB/BaiF CoA transferase family protein [Pigmentiphaga sp.]